MRSRFSTSSWFFTNMALYICLIFYLHFHYRLYFVECILSLFSQSFILCWSYFIYIFTIVYISLIFDKFSWSGWMTYQIINSNKPRQSNPNRLSNSLQIYSKDYDVHMWRTNARRQPIAKIVTYYARLRRQIWLWDISIHMKMNAEFQRDYLTLYILVLCMILMFLPIDHDYQSECLHVLKCGVQYHMRGDFCVNPFATYNISVFTNFTIHIVPRIFLQYFPIITRKSWRNISSLLVEW